MEPAFDLLIANGTVVNHDGIGVREIGIRDGRIAAIGRFPHGRAAEIMDCGGLHVLPGVIDTQVHLREPGAEHKEDLETGGRAAVLGGVTAVFEMPNTDPLTVTEAALADKVARATDRMACDFAFYVGGTHDNAHDLPTLERLPGCCGVKVFMGSSTGDLLVPDDAGIAAILTRIHRRAAFHSEDEARLASRKGDRRRNDPASHPIWRDAEAARHATERLLGLARTAGKRIHVLHVSTADELPLLAANRDIASVELTANHLTLAGPEAYERLGTLAQMNPPLRDARHRDALWAAVASGLVDVLGSDHAPHTLEEKARPYPELAVGNARRADARSRHARSREPRPTDDRTLRRLDEPRTLAPIRDRRQGAHRRRVRCRPDHRRHGARGDHHQPLDRQPLRLDSVRRREGQGLAGLDAGAGQGGRPRWRDRRKGRWPAHAIPGGAAARAIGRRRA